MSTSADPIPSIIRWLLEKLRDQGENVLEYHLEPDAITTGNNYCSGIAKLKVKLHRGGDDIEKSFVLKIPSQSRFYEQVSKLNMYQNELLVYSDILPAMSKILPLNFIATSYIPPNGDNLVLDDLNESGYVMLDKKTQLDLNHSLAALKALATFHALSIKLHETSKETLDLIRIPARDLPKPGTPNPVFEKFYNTAATLGLDQISLQKVHEFVVNMPEKVFNHTMIPSETLNVLCHGDFWMGNLLFKRTADVDVKILDYQMAHWSSPVIDLIEFFVTSVRFEVFSGNREVLVETYLETFNGLLESLGSAVRYTKDELEKDIRCYKSFHLYNMGPYMSAVLCEQEDPFNYSGKDNPVYKEKKYKDAVINWIGYLREKDLL